MDTESERETWELDGRVSTDGRSSHCLSGARLPSSVSGSPNMVSDGASASYARPSGRPQTRTTRGYWEIGSRALAVGQVSLVIGLDCLACRAEGSIRKTGPTGRYHRTRGAPASRTSCRLTLSRAAQASLKRGYYAKVTPQERGIAVTVAPVFAATTPALGPERRVSSGRRCSAARGLSSPKPERL